MTAFWWALLTAGIWGIVPLLEKLGLAKSDPVLGVFARSLGVVAGVVGWAMWWSPWKALGAMSLRSFALLATSGFLASVVGQLAFYHALKAGSISQVTPVAGAYPLIAALFGWFVLREVMNPARVLGVGCIVLGVWLLRH